MTLRASVTIAQMTCLSLVFWWPRHRLKLVFYGLPKSTASYFRYLLAAASILSVLITLYRLPGQSPQPHKPGPRILTAGIWTLHFGIDNAGRDSQRGVRDLIKWENLCAVSS